MDAQMSAAGPRVGLVTIGRNEGERLKRCLRSVPDGCPVVYVDSGSTDGSVAFAESLGMDVENLSMDRPFTAARARNAGWRRLLAAHPGLTYIQFVDGDCELDPDWIAQGTRALDAEPDLCATFGRVRERHPQASIYNALCDDEWNVPVGLADSCGGIAMFRVEPLVLADGYAEDLIAGEEPDLCLRLRHKGWKVRRIDAEMTLHDADMHRFGQMWLRIRRSGHAYAEHVERHGANADPNWRHQRNSIIVWGGIVPASIVVLALLGLVGWSSTAAMSALLLALLYPAQVARLALRKWRGGARPGFALIYGGMIMLGKLAQFGGLVRYHLQRHRGQTHQLIEYRAMGTTKKR
jgi:glycosyltransferase involved in cell wall biosynthesis